MPPAGPTPPLAVGEAELVLSNSMLRNASIEERVAAAAAADFAGIGLSLASLRILNQSGWSNARLKALLDDHGLYVAEFEGGSGFEAHGPAPELAELPGLTYLDVAAQVAAIEAAAFFGSRNLQVVGSFGALEDDVAESFADLCDRAAEYGLAVAIEFLPTTSIPDAGTASDIVAKAGRANGGLCVDSWHYYRGPTTEKQFHAIDSGKVFMIQIDDGTLEPQLPAYITDTVLHRVAPGAGEFDLEWFLSTLWATGVEAPISVEVLSAELDQLPAKEVAVLTATATRDLIKAARAQSAPFPKVAP